MPSVARRSGTPFRAFRESRRAALLAAALCSPGLARAEPAGSPSHGAEAASAPAWLSEYERGHWAAAIELLETLPEGSRTAWHWLHLARAREKRGQLVEAFAAYERLRDVANDAPRAPGMKEIAQKAALESAAVSVRLPWAEVVLNVEVPVGGFVFIDQQWLEPARMRSPYPLNPGWHTFLVESNGAIIAARRVHFEEGQTRRVPLDPLPGSSRAPAAQAKAQPERPAAAAPAHAKPTAPRSNELTWRAPAAAPVDTQAHDNLRTTAYVALGVGGLAALVGTGLAISALNTREDEMQAAFGCASVCRNIPNTWQDKATAASFAYGVGLIGLVAGGVLLLAHSQYQAPPSVKVADIELEPRVATNGAALHGRF